MSHFEVSLNATVEMFRNSTEIGGRDLFACSVDEWTMFQQLGRDFGWEPLGTTYLVPAESKAVAAAFHGYSAGDTKDPKIIEATDAINWARALEDRQRSVKLSGAESEPAGPQRADTDRTASGTELLDEFIEYAYGGSFNFVLAEVAGPL